jgi:hypothetical protein
MALLYSQLWVQEIVLGSQVSSTQCNELERVYSERSYRKFQENTKNPGLRSTRQSATEMSYYRKLWIDDGMKKAAYPSA